MGEDDRSGLTTIFKEKVHMFIVGWVEKLGVGEQFDPPQLQTVYLFKLLLNIRPVFGEIH